MSRRVRRSARQRQLHDGGDRYVGIGFAAETAQRNARTIINTIVQLLYHHASGVIVARTAKVSASRSDFVTRYSMDLSLTSFSRFRLEDSLAASRAQVAHGTTVSTLSIGHCAGPMPPGPLRSRGLPRRPAP